MRTSRLAAIGAVLLASTTALAQEITLKPGLIEGRSLTYEVIQNLTIEQRNTPDADPATYKSEVTAVLSLDIADVNNDGKARVNCDVAMFKTRYEDPQGPTTVAYDMQPDDTPAGLAALETILADAVITFTVSPRGAVSDLAGLEDFYAAIDQNDDATVELFGFFRPDMLTELLTKLFSAEGGIGTHQVGDSWTDSRRVPLGSGGAIEVTTDSTLQVVKDEFVAIAGFTSFELYVPRERAENVPSVSLGQSEGQLLTRWDAEEGALISRFSNHTVTMDWLREGPDDSTLRIVQTQRAETKIQRK